MHLQRLKADCDLVWFATGTNIRKEKRRLLHTEAQSSDPIVTQVLTTMGLKGKAKKIDQTERL